MGDDPLINLNLGKILIISLFTELFRIQIEAGGGDISLVVHRWGFHQEDKAESNDVIIHNIAFKAVSDGDSYGSILKTPSLHKSAYQVYRSKSKDTYWPRGLEYA